MRTRSAAALLVLASLAPTTVRAQVTPRSCIESLSDEEIDVRVEGIQRRLDAGSRGARWYWYLWLSSMAAAGVGQMAWALVTDDQKIRRERWIGTTGSFLTVGALLIQPFVPAYAASRLRRAPSRTREERIDKLLLAERWLSRAARRERMGRSVLEYLQVAAYTLTTSLLLGVRWDDGVGAGLNVASALVVGNSRILSVPTRAIRDWDSYRVAPGACLARHLHPEPETRVELHPAGLGLALTVTFAGPRL